MDMDRERKTDIKPVDPAEPARPAKESPIRIPDRPNEDIPVTEVAEAVYVEALGATEVTAVEAITPDPIEFPVDSAEVNPNGPSTALMGIPRMPVTIATGIKIIILIIAKMKPKPKEPRLSEAGFGPTRRGRTGIRVSISIPLPAPGRG
jgi:hypothetical protein